MLDTDTKRRIDTARDILVGKVPDPKSQVEQITIALIYKFMDDMDAESEEFGGKRKFFADEFSRYGWAKLMHSGLGGHEILGLYAEAITKMPENPGIPPLFRDIFKNAYLPYRDPETLRSFLKIIDEFSYDHSERLGDAFEYLLSVLGSQGDAGQFRTPRQIIDFMVDIVDPKKTDSILDPACGTAGFLISSYKHILKANADDRGNSNLTPDEKGRLAKNFKGYDISPDMVRLSLVNLYLHGFADPHIFEYDTLTSKDRWNEYADVILANPPFMSPKGGIKPHNNFTVQSKRSEVLFVDYMAEHLTPNGRAGIIVPEGIIFQSQTAYKQLRKMLIDEYLIAVISLPAGVFNPYSGVKTSILILDKSLAKKTNCIAFFKVNNDGYGLGAQRRPIDKNDLPQVHAEISEYIDCLRKGESVEDLQPTMGLIVDKEKVAANGEFNLSGERYRENSSPASKYSFVSLGDICDLIGGSTPSKKIKSYWTNGSVKWISSKHIDGHGRINGFELISQLAIEASSTRVAPKNSTIIITRVSVGKYAFADDDYAINQDLTALVTKDALRLIPEFIGILAPNIASIVDRSAEGIGVRGVTRNFLSGIQIPLPPLEVQKEIVSEIEGYQKIIDGARAVIDNYRPHIAIDPEWPMVEIGDIYLIEYGIAESIPENLDPEGIRIISTAEAKIDGTLDLSKIRRIKKRPSYDKFILERDTLLFNWRNAPKHVGKTVIFNESDGDYVYASFLLSLTKKIPKVENRFVCVILNQLREAGYFMRMSRQAVNQTNFNATELAKTHIPLPSHEIQRAIVAEIEAEQALVNNNRELIERMEKKIQAVLARIWGEG